MQLATLAFFMYEWDDEIIIPTLENIRSHIKDVIDDHKMTYGHPNYFYSQRFGMYLDNERTSFSDANCALNQAITLGGRFAINPKHFDYYARQIMSLYDQSGYDDFFCFRDDFVANPDSFQDVQIPLPLP
jgi:hypothetical protein